MWRHITMFAASTGLILVALALPAGVGAGVRGVLPGQQPLSQDSWLPSWLPWPWSRRPQPLRTVIITPILPNGTRAEPAALRLPEDQIAREHLRPENPPPELLGRSSADPWYSYNSSDAIPLIPSSLAWMIDADRMVKRATDGGLDISVARQLSELVAATYCNSSNLQPWNCTRCGPGFKQKRAIFDPHWDLQGFVGWSDDLDAIVVAFRGTDSHSYYNWAENMRTWRTDLALSYDGIPPHALVHGGFFYSYNNSYLAGNVSAAVSELVDEHVAKARGGGGGGAGGRWLLDRRRRRGKSSSRDGEGGGLTPSDDVERYRKEQSSFETRADDTTNRLTLAPTVFVSGHSLGGALATLAALDLRITLGLPDVRVISFGSPRVGNAVFAKWFEEKVGPHWRFTHNRDIVPSLPPLYMGFRHVAEEVWVVDSLLNGHTLVGVCDGGEDPRCHASMCHLGLCSSLADHLLYLSRMYSPHPDGC